MRLAHEVANVGTIRLRAAVGGRLLGESAVIPTADAARTRSISVTRKVTSFPGRLRRQPAPRPRTSASPPAGGYGGEGTKSTVTICPNRPTGCGRVLSVDMQSQTLRTNPPETSPAQATTSVVGRTNARGKIATGARSVRLPP